MSTDELLADRPCVGCGGLGFRIARVEAGRAGSRACVLECATCALPSETLRYRVKPILIERLLESAAVLVLGAADLYARKLLALKIHVKFKWVVPATQALRRAVRGQTEG